VDGYFGGINNGLSRGDKGPPSLFNFMVDTVSLLDLAVSKLSGNNNQDTLFMKATFVGNGKDFLRDTMFAEPWRKNETYEQAY
ncbi:hypothetical protein SB761_33500, partial [Pseudomonas sp. SIMBA_064]